MKHIKQAKQERGKGVIGDDDNLGSISRREERYPDRDRPEPGSTSSLEEADREPEPGSASLEEHWPEHGEGHSRTTELVQAIVAQEVQHFSGPLPPPEDFGKFEEVLPGAADRILAMAELDIRSKARDAETQTVAESKALLFVARAYGVVPALFVGLGAIGAYNNSIATVVAGVVGGLVTTAPHMINSIRRSGKPPVSDADQNQLSTGN